MAKYLHLAVKMKKSYKQIKNKLDWLLKIELKKCLTNFSVRHKLYIILF